MSRQAGMLWIAATVAMATLWAGAAFDRRRRREHRRLARPEIERWEEGGAVPTGAGRTAA